MDKHLFSTKKQSSRLSKLMGALIIMAMISLLLPSASLGQAADTAKATLPIGTSQVTKQTYPKTVGYLSFIVPIVTVSNTTAYNFSHATGSIGFPVGINVLYSDRFGFSYEFTPTIKSAGGTSKMSNLLFDPGTMFRFDHGFTIITRLAFETSGRYGFTPVFNKVYARTKDVNYFIALSLPARFGNAANASVGLNVQFGFTFN